MRSTYIVTTTLHTTTAIAVFKQFLHVYTSRCGEQILIFRNDRLFRHFSVCTVTFPLQIAKQRVVSDYTTLDALKHLHQFSNVIFNKTVLYYSISSLQLSAHYCDQVDLPKTTTDISPTSSFSLCFDLHPEICRTCTDHDLLLDVLFRL